MPEPKDSAEDDSAQDTPQVVPGLGADGTPEDRGLARELDEESRPGKGENQAGFLKEKD